MAKELFKALSLLLHYPDENLQGMVPEIVDVLKNQTLVPSDITARLITLATRLLESDLLESQTLYVSQFDQTRMLSLYLFEHVHGDSKDRGQAMVDLRVFYEDHGLVMSSQEFPDYLPLLLEFISFASVTGSDSLLSNVRPIIVLLAERLGQRKSIYTVIMEAILALTPQDQVHLSLEVASPSQEPASLRDETWEEEPVLFNSGSLQNKICAGGVL